MEWEQLFSKKDIKTDYLTVKGNLIGWKDTIIQISNISMITAGDLDPRPFPKWSLGLLLLGAMFWKFSSFLGFLLYVAGGAWIYFWYQAVMEDSKKKRMSMQLNSGRVVSIIFYSKEFLDEVIDKLNTILLTPNTSENITINIKDNLFCDDSSIIKN